MDLIEEIRTVSNDIETDVHTSPRTLARRLQTPLRSLENTALADTNVNSKSMIMVCIDGTHDQTLPPADSNTCSSSQNLSHKYCVRTTPNGLNTTMVRATNCHKMSPQCIMQNGENVNTDKSESTSWCRIRNDNMLDHYTVEEAIGRGKFAVVKRCCHKASGRQYAAKFMRKRRKGKDCRSECLNEVSMLEMALIHPRLVDIIEVYETSHEIIIIMEYASGGELFQRVVVEENIDEQETRRLLRQVVEGVHFLHERSIVHLDIKPQNILLTNSGSPTNIKLCDLGFARPIHSGEDVRDILGTPDYVAPEILSYEPIHIGSDMWSIGVLAYVMLTGFSPFAGDTKQETFLNISQINLDFPSDLFENISPHAVDFITKLLVREPVERLTTQQCLNHPWLQTPVTTPKGSPIGQRRALTPPSPDTLAEEPTKKCRCDMSSPSPTPSTSSSCQSCDHNISSITVNLTFNTDNKTNSITSVTLPESPVHSPGGSTQSHDDSLDVDTVHSLDVTVESPGGDVHSPEGATYSE